MYDCFLHFVNPMRQQPKKRVQIRQVLYDILDLTWGYTTFVGRVPKRIYLLGMKTNANKLTVCYNVIFIGNFSRRRKRQKCNQSNEFRQTDVVGKSLVSLNQ